MACLGQMYAAEHHFPFWVMEYLQSRADNLLHLGGANKPFILGNVLHFFIAILLQFVCFLDANKYALFLQALFLQVFTMLAPVNYAHVMCSNFHI